MSKSSPDRSGGEKRIKREGVTNIYAMKMQKVMVNTEEWAKGKDESKELREILAGGC